MKLTYVVPRYGLEVVGGAESAARMLAERLVADRGWSVEALTTCARDAMTWANEYPPGEETINGVRVLRFRSERGRDPLFHPYSGALLQKPEMATEEDASRWIDLQGPLCPELLEAIPACDADLVIFYPYLYYPTVRGLPFVAERSVMHPALHDESPARLSVFTPVFSAARGLVFQTYGERSLAHRLFDVAGTRQVVLGLGVEEAGMSGATDGPGSAAEARVRFGLAERPYLMTVGRYLDEHKGSATLGRYFAEYKRRRPGPLALVLAGQVVTPPPEGPDVISAGPVDELTKWGLLRGATALVSPSRFEAFSLAVVEGWTAGAAVLVNWWCEATREHCERSGGGLWYEDYPTFELAVDRLVNDTAARAALVRRGQRYVEDNFRWKQILPRYCAFLENVAAHP